MATAEPPSGEGIREMLETRREPFHVLLTSDGKRHEGEFRMFVNEKSRAPYFVETATEAVFPFQNVLTAVH